MFTNKISEITRIDRLRNIEKKNVGVDRLSVKRFRKITSITLFFRANKFVINESLVIVLLEGVQVEWRKTEGTRECTKEVVNFSRAL